MLLGMVTPYLPPPIETATDPVHSAADMCQRWRALMGPLGFGERLVWIGFVGADRCMYKTLSQVPFALAPDAALAEDVMSRTAVRGRQLRRRHHRGAAIDPARSGPISDLDRQWSGAAHRSSRGIWVPLEPIFRANDDSLVQIEPELERSTLSATMCYMERIGLRELRQNASRYISRVAKGET